ncbi:MAG: DUF4330 domain-containing protein [Defluviitaleaceae bacterium]|nr:DUF4330 domain-containing protein [Defluviitaleaceae bacterium]
MIDKDARLFGKVNIIDFFIVLALIAVVIFGVHQLRGDEGGLFIAPETREFNISFFMEEVENFTAYAINIGDNVFDNGRNVAMGEVTALDISDAIIWNPNQYGQLIASDKPGFSSLEIHARLSAVPSENGILIAGNRYGIGHSLAVRAGSSVMFMRISGLSEIGA